MILPNKDPSGFCTGLLFTSSFWSNPKIPHPPENLSRESGHFLIPLLLGIFLIAGLLLVALWTMSKINQWKTKPPIIPAVDFRFTRQDITAAFVSSLPKMTPELNLELARSKQTEFIERADVKSLAWGWLNLGTNTAQVKVPVTYVYHLRLNDPWYLELSTNTIVVVAPTIRAGLPPAIHTDELDFKAFRGWARLSPSDLLDQLHRDLTPILTEYAEDPRRIDLVRETCRQSVEQFVRKWLDGQSQWNGANQIFVLFADEQTNQFRPNLFLRPPGQNQLKP